MTEIKFLSEPTVELLDFMGTDASPVQAARVSTKGAQVEEGAETGLNNFLMRESHLSPFEHAVLKFRFHVPKFTQVQLRTHRTISWNVESGRYKEWGPTFYLPSVDRPVKQVGKTGEYTFEGDDDLWVETHSQIKMLSVRAWNVYKHLLEEGTAKEVARMVLPDNAYTSSIATGNLRAWLNFVGLRTQLKGSKPQYEIEQVGELVGDYIQEKFPSVWSAWEKAGYPKV